MYLRRIGLMLCGCVAAVCGIQAQQVSPRIAGLERNAEYMSLLQEDARLQVREDSVARAADALRQRFKDNPAMREQYAKDILTLEGQIFNIRNAKGRLTDRISAIEQDWVISNLDSPAARIPEAPADPVIAIPEKEKVRNLVYNKYFAGQLAAADYAALKQAQRQETLAEEYAARFLANYQQISRLAGQYAEAKDETEAGDLYGKYKTLQGINAVLADSLTVVWNDIFDNKSYAYGYMLDKLGQEEILTREEQALSQAAQQLAEGRGTYASDALTDYLLRKRVLVDYETQVATLLRLDAARDSLATVAAKLKEIDPRLPKIEAAERFFIDYEPITFSSPSKYNTTHPIPEVKVFRQGTVYRIQIGTFSAKRPVSVFKGAYPLSYQKDDKGKWRYFAGGFATADEAKAAQKQLKAKGFVRPEIAVWRDGVYHNFTHEPQQNVQMYRVEIEKVTSLSDAVKGAIAAAAPGRELSRVGPQLFIVGLFEERSEADRVAEAIRNADGTLEIKVAEVLENPE